MLNRIKDTLKNPFAPFVVLFVSWALLQAILLLSFGIVTTQEAPKYYTQCHNLLAHGSFTDNRFTFYSVYIFLHVIFYKLGFETMGVYLFQLFLNFYASCLFYRLNEKLSGKKIVGIIATLLLYMTQPFEMWTVFLYTESVFSSLLIIFTYCFFLLDQRNTKNALLTVFVFVLLLFARPTGLLLVPVLSFYFFLKLIKQKRYLWATTFTITVAVSFVYLLDYAMHSSQKFDFMKPFLEKEVLCYIPTLNAAPLTEHSTSDDFWTIGTYLIHHKKEFLYLSYEKFVSYWGFLRYADSRMHNLYFVCFFYPIYFFGLTGLVKMYRTHKKALLFIVALLFVYTLSVILTCDDWNNRFNVPVLPFVILSAAYGIGYWPGKWWRNVYE